MSQIGQTASITFITGLPGSGKSLRAVYHMLKMVAAGELVFASNFTGLKVKGVTEWADPHDWKNLPPGAILFVDEAQEFFRARRSGDPPPYLTDMERIRHGGVRLVVITQQPNYLDTHLRGLCGLHEHLKRLNGKEGARIMRHHEVIEDVRSPKAAQRYDGEDWAYPVECYAAYESAEVHTVKYVMASKVKKALWITGICAAACLAGIGVIVAKVRAADDTPARSAPAKPAATAPTDIPAGRGTVQPLTAEQWLSRLTPRFAGMPESAPIFDGREVLSVPRRFCVVSGEGNAARCSCYTEQVTPIPDVPNAVCVHVARWGEYDPFRASEPAPGVAPVAPAVVEPSPVAATGIRTPPTSVGSPAAGQVQ